MSRNGLGLRSRRGGFTLIELLMVVVIIGILASVGMKRYDKAREKAFRVTLVSDMRSLIEHEELHNIANSTYGQLADLSRYHSSPGVAITVTYAAVDGWSATGTHDGVPGYSCGIFVGGAPAAGGAPATEREILVCADTP